MSSLPDSNKLDQELRALRQGGVVLPRHPARAMQSYGEGYVTNEGLHRAAEGDLRNMGVRLGRTITDSEYHSPEVQRIMSENKAFINAMGQRRGYIGGRMSKESRRKSQDERWSGSLSKTSMVGGGSTPMGGDVYSAIPRFYDPLEYWDLSGLPWNIADEGHRHKLHKWLRLYYATHYLVPILVDIFTRFPLVGMELESKDNKITEIYEDIFLNQLNYEDFLVSLGREYWCALPGEVIQSAEGIVDIAKVRAGDEVLTHTGDIKKVRGASSREYEGKYVELRPHYGLPMRYTYGHPFLVRRDNSVEWIPIEDVRTSDELFVPVDRRCTECAKINVWDTLSRDEWLPVPTEQEVEALEIPEHISWTDSPQRYRSWVKRQIQALTPGDVWKRNARFAQHTPLSGQIDLTDELLWFLGLYLAEGYVTKDGVQIALHAKEIEYADCVVALAASLGLNAVVRPGSSENGIVVVIYSIAFGAWMRSVFGTGVDHKRIPEWLMTLETDRQCHLLRGYFDGDGHYGTKRVFAAAKSLSLALQVERLIRRTGTVTTINRADSVTDQGTECTWYMVGPCVAHTKHFMDRIGVPTFIPEGVCAFATWEWNGYWVKTFKVDHGHYAGPVYNIEVEDDHSYVGSVATHNCVGEAFPLGSFDEDLGIWEHEELINPEDVVIDNFPLLGTQQLKIVPPDYLRRIAQTQSPAREWYMLQEQYEDLIPYLLKGEHIPISPVMLRQVANKMNDWDDHGTPILMRGLRTLLHEEKLLASQDAIAERLYSPFILAKLGIMDMGDGLPPWIPTPDEIQSVRDDIDIAMASDFRVMVHHFGLEMESVFGREQMPRLGDDFDRIERRLMQVFGVNPSLLSAGSNAQPYASSALQAEFMNQILRTFQKMLKAHFKERAMVVAEAQGHYDYERKGQTRVPIYETVVEWDDEGNKRLVRKPKLLVPDLVFATFDLRDEATERQFLQGLREAGVPIPDEKLMIGVSWKKDDYIEQYNRDTMHKTLSQQRAKMDTYIACVIQGLPVPMDLKYEVESVLMGGTGPAGAPPQMGEGQGSPVGMAPGGGGKGGGGIEMPPPPGALGPGGPGGEMPPGGGPPGNVPDVSNERRQGLKYNTHVASDNPWSVCPNCGEEHSDIIEPVQRLSENPSRQGMPVRTCNICAGHQPEDIQSEIPDAPPPGHPWDWGGWHNSKFADAMRKRAVVIRDAIELSGGFVPESFEPEIPKTSDTVEGETDDPDTWKLRASQSVKEEDGQKVIVESHRKRVDLPIDPTKRYSVIDPLSDPIEISE